MSTPHIDAMASATDDHGTDGTSISRTPHAQAVITHSTKLRRPTAAIIRPLKRGGGRAREIDHEDRADEGSRLIERRSGQMKAHVGEDGHEVEQHAEADREGREQLRIAQVGHHLTQRGGQLLARTKFFSRGSSVATMTRHAAVRTASAAKPPRHPT